MYAQDLFTPIHVRVRHNNLAVETTGPQQRGIEHIGAVRGSNQDYALVRLEAVHLHQQLVQCLLPLVVTAAEAGTTMAADGVDLVDKDDAGGVLLALFEHVAHPAGADTDEHLDEVRTGDREEGNIRLAGDGARQQGLTRARGADKKAALRNLAA